MNETYRQYLIDGERAGARYALTAPRNVPFGIAGSQMGKRPGSSLEFIDHREYQPGDDLRRIDWSGFARSDKLTVKLYRDEVSPHLDIVIDGLMLHGTGRKSQGASDARISGSFCDCGSQCRVLSHRLGRRRWLSAGGQWHRPTINLGRDRFCLPWRPVNVICQTSPIVASVWVACVAQ